MEFKQLKYFMAVADSGSYTRAAALLNIAQPVLSRQVRQLEVELRCNLLNRHGRGVTLTEQGNILLAHAREIDSKIQAIHDEVRTDLSSPAGKLAIGMPPTVARMMTLPLIRALHEALPNAHFVFSEGLTSGLQSCLHDGRLDIALLNSPNHNRGLHTVKVSEDVLYLIAPKADDNPRLHSSIDAYTLAQLPLIIPSSQNTFRHLIEQGLTQFNLKPNVALEMDSVGMMLHLVREGYGYAVLSRHVLTLTRYAQELRLVPIDSPVMRRHLFLAVSDRHLMSCLQRRAFEVIQAVCEQHFQSVPESAQAQG